MKKNVLLAVCILIFSVINAQQLSYYLENVGGNDNNDDKTPATAWRFLNKGKNILILLLIGLILALVCPNVSGQTWNLTWSDEFNGTGVPDPTKWEQPAYNRRDNGNGPDGWWEPDDSYMDGAGNLAIRVRRVPNRNADSDPYDYNVGAVRTKGKFMPTYGKFEIRAQMPTMRGWWVAFWMMQGIEDQVGNGGVDGSEVDIFEGWGTTDRISHAVHWDGYGPGSGTVEHVETIPGLQSGYHTFTLIWKPTIYIFYVDGIEQWRTTGGGICNQPGYIKLTGELSTDPVAISVFGDPAGMLYPDHFLVDYCRVYSASPGVVFYQDGSYGGASSQSIQPGNYTTAQLASMGVPNDWASSLQIPSGWTVTMYANDNFSGQSWTLTADTPNFFALSPTSANDQMSSCTIQATASGVTFYQNTDYGGTASQVIQPGTYTMAQLASMGVPDNWASSVRIPSGWTMTMYEHDNFTGQAWTVTADISNFVVLSPASANDKVSSCVIHDANLALNKPATQSSTFGLPTAVAASAVDGNTDGDFSHGSVASTSDNSTNQPWWQVDLGAAAKIATVNVWNRTDCCSQRLTNYHIFVSNSPFTSATVAGTQAQAGVKDYFHIGIAGTPSSIVINDTGRYVRLQLESTDVAINLAELQVYGTFTNTSSARLNTYDRAPSNNNQSTVKISPNPAVSVIHVSGAAAGSNFSIVNSDGQTVHNNRLQTYINVESLAKGVYFLQITSGSNKQTIKFIKL